MFDYLINHAIKNVWCSPDQDNQAIIKPVRLTGLNGVLNRYKVGWDLIKLPIPNTKFHLWHVGQVNPVLLNLFNKELSWVSLSESSNKNNLIVDCYIKNGIQLPRFETWYMITKTKNLIIAVKKNNKIDFDFNEDDIYLRTYLNSYYSSTRSVNLIDHTKTNGKVIKNQSDILLLQSEVENKRTLVGITNCFVNGKWVKDINLITCQIGDIVEYVYDSSIYKVIDFNLSTLPTFDSLIDNCGKYLLHYEGNDNIINYQDDIDLYLINTLTNKGIYIHKNKSDTFRNLTHKDYSVNVAYVNSYLEHFSINQVIDISNIKLRLHIRKSGYDRSLILEKNRINELYKLSDNLIVNALLGVNSNVDCWRADKLEQTTYINLMGSNFEQITKSKVVDTYGFSAIAKLVADTPKQVIVNGLSKTVNVPYLLAFNSTAYEYDSNGYLLDFYRHDSGETYSVRNNNTQYVEMIAGEGLDTLDEHYAPNSFTIDPKVNYRVYSCDIENNIPNNNWIDVTNTYTLSMLNHPLKLIMIRTDKKFLSYSFEINFEEGVLEFPIKYFQNRNNVLDDLEMQVPMGELDVFLNGKSLIEGLDYYYDNPKIIIVNKSYINHFGLQKITIRYTGFCNNLLKRNNVTDSGFIQKNRVSDNHRFNIKDGKVQRIVVDGSLRLSNQVYYYDDLGSGSIQAIDNGKPYSIRDIIVPMNEIANKETYLFKDQCDLIDKSVCDYYTFNINQQSNLNLNVVSQRHYLYSPFLSRVLNELIDLAIIIPSGIHYDDDFVRGKCQAYEELLKYDPIHVDNRHSKDFVIVHPHQFNNVVILDFDKFKFYSKVVNIYTKGIVDISNHIRLL